MTDARVLFSMRKAIVYIRVSTEEQAEKGYSLQAQKEECHRKAKELECDEILDFGDEGVSGSILERPGLMDAFARLKAKDIAYFICLDSSRLSRNTAHQLIIFDFLKKHDCRPVFVRSSIEDTPEGKFQLTVMSAVDEYERARFQLRSELGKRAKASRGGLTHSPNLYGYDFDKETDMLHINREQAEIVKKMFKWVVEEETGPHLIATRLNDMGIPSPRGKMWQKATVKRILNNTAYKGVLYIRKYDSRETKFNKYKKEEERVKRKIKPKNEWIPVSVPVIIDEETWNRAQVVIEKARRKRSGANVAEYLLSGLLRCGLCGSTLHGSLATGRKGAKHRYYVCTARSPGITGKEKCKLPFLRAEALEDPVWNQVSVWLNNPEELKKELARDDENNAAVLQELKDLAEDIENIKKEKERIITLYQKSFIDDAEAEKRFNEIKKRESRALNKKAELEQFLNRKLTEKDVEDLDEILNSVIDRINDLDFDDKKTVVNSLVDEIEVWPDRLKIKAKIPAFIKIEPF